MDKRLNYGGLMGMNSQNARIQAHDRALKVGILALKHLEL